MREPRKSPSIHLRSKTRHSLTRSPSASARSASWSESTARTLPIGQHAWKFSGDPERAGDTGRDVSAWVREVQERGAGEIVLNCMDTDGVRTGYDLEQLAAVRAICQVPLVASGGAGAIEHFTDVFAHAGVDAALAASVFHSGSIRIPELKRELRYAGIAVRPTDLEDSCAW